MIYFSNPISRFFAIAAFALPALTLGSCIASGDGIGVGNGTGAGSGKASLVLEDMQWGRLVNVFDLAGDLVETDIVIRESVQSDGIRFTLSQNPITQVEILTVLLTQGTPAFEEALADARSGLTSLQAKSFDSPGPFTKLARNGAIRLVFSEFLDPSSVDRQTIQVLVGTSEASPSSLEMRYVVKEDVGQDGEPVGVVILDPTISKIDSQQLGVPENGIGFPESA